MTKVTTNGGAYFLTDDGSKLILKSNGSLENQPIELEVYSNNQIWVRTHNLNNNGNTKCLHVEDQEKLEDLDGKEIMLHEEEKSMIHYL